jgi:chromosome segregation ATPase
MDIPQVLTILTETAPLVLAVIILSGVVLLTLYASVKVVIPALRETVEMFEAQRTSWRSLIDEQKKYHERLSCELSDRVTSLEAKSKMQEAEIERQKGEIERLQAEDKIKTARIAELEAEIEKLRAEDKRKSARIAELEAELQKVQAERDELRHRLDALEKVAEKPAETASVEKK